MAHYSDRIRLVLILWYRYCKAIAESWVDAWTVPAHAVGRQWGEPPTAATSLAQRCHQPSVAYGGTHGRWGWDADRRAAARTRERKAVEGRRKPRRRRGGCACREVVMVVSPPCVGSACGQTPAASRRGGGGSSCGRGQRWVAESGGDGQGGMVREVSITAIVSQAHSFAQVLTQSGRHGCGTARASGAAASQ